MGETNMFKSRLGFILVSAGCAIGIGNVWRFPYIAGQYGGGIFVVFYLLFLLIMGVPTLAMELAVGRSTKKSAWSAYKELEKPGSKWHLHGIACIAGNVILMMYYTTVAGWMLGYFFKYIRGTFDGIQPEQINNVFSDLQAQPVTMTILMALVVIAGFVVLSFGVQKGLENVSKFIMSALLILMVVLAVNSLLLPHAGEGLKFYLIPNWEKAQEVGLLNVIVQALCQASFTLSIGIASMQIFGSYMSSEKTLFSESVIICVLDTFVAIFSGLIIFPACFAYDIEPNAGPALIFQTLPNVFGNMPLGRVWGALFFLFMTFASFSTVIAVFENIIALSEDMFHWKRLKSIIVSGIGLLVLSMPCVLGFNVWKNVVFFGGRNILDLEDFIVSSVLLPGGCIVFLLFCVTKWGWGYENFLKEANIGSGIKLSTSKGLKVYFQWILPVLLIVVLGSGLLSAFGVI